MQVRLKAMYFMVVIVQLTSIIMFPTQSHSDDAVIARVITSRDDTASDAGKLWFKVKDGKSVTKRVAIYNSSTKPSKIYLSFVSAIRESSGNLKLNPEVPFEAIKYFKLSRNNFILKSKGVQIVEVKATSPRNAPNESFDFYLKVSSQVVGSKKSRAGKSIGIQIPVATAFALPAFIGIGKFEDQDFGFSVKNISGALDKNEFESIRIVIENTGNVPMKFSGTIQLSSVTLNSVRTEPLKFNTKVIPVGFTKYVDISLPSIITEGKYKVYLEVSNGRLSKKMLEEFNLKFPYPNTFFDNLLRIFVGIVSILMLFISLGYLRRGTNSLFIKKMISIWSFIRQRFLKFQLSPVQPPSEEFPHSEINTESLTEFSNINYGEELVSKTVRNERVRKRSASSQNSVTKSKELRSVKKISKKKRQ